ncbi:sulfite exporter TauE/SafE family protein [Pacificibacter marinus]|uniref:sulfite exporter TauE/SafE family protein n=1 Tax=Pacificibacter marinus TaxID=658057 RepID=UPI001C070DDC|nr:sulfite exporter TauE/SafE family protein [Pacificibacter marinus]MBU2866224.1 sulfite exporter TauE/SafE family protein [Pacificibacter marinus]
MDLIFNNLSTMAIVFAIGITLLAGFVKGATGFALPMIMVSGLATVLPPDVAIAALIVPTVVSNVWQALRGGGVGAAVTVASRYKLYIGTLLVVIVITAQLVSAMSHDAIMLTIGIPITLLALVLLSGKKFSISDGGRKFADVIIGTISGFLGGLAGIWGPLTVMYLTALETPKKDQVRVTGVIFSAGAVVLGLSHLKSGLLNAQTIPLSLFMIIPVLIGQTLGNRLQDRLDQQKFKRLTLLVLVIAGLNLIRRGMM